MLPKDLFAHWKEVRKDLVATVEAFEESELAFAPFEGCWSVGQILLHIADAEDGWLRYCVTKELEKWPDFYTLVNFPDKSSILQALEEVHARTTAYIAGLDETTIEAIVATPAGDEIPLLWILWHVIEHEIHHRGELTLILGMLGKEGKIL
ncbi:MAG: DinB family protein [Anaerolineales bacterium]|jgi:uncharacterized damage-inducible protein DinB